MIIPVRCFTCNKVIANKWNMYEKLLEEGMEIKDIYKKLEIKSYCCQRMFMTQINFSEKLNMYEKLPNRVVCKKPDNRVPRVYYAR